MASIIFWLRAADKNESGDYIYKPNAMHRRDGQSDEAREANIKRVLCSLLLFDDHQPFSDFVRSRGITEHRVGHLAELCASLANMSPASTTVEIAGNLFDKVADILERMPPDIICIFCCVSSRIATTLFERAAIRDSTNAHSNTLHIARCLHPMLVEIDRDIAMGGKWLARGKFDPFTFAAIVLGIYCAPAECIADLMRASGDAGLARRAHIALSQSEFKRANNAAQWERTLANYQNLIQCQQPEASPDGLVAKNAMAGVGIANGGKAGANSRIMHQLGESALVEDLEATGSGGVAMCLGAVSKMFHLFTKIHEPSRDISQSPKHDPTSPRLTVANSPNWCPEVVVCRVPTSGGKCIDLRTAHL